MVGSCGPDQEPAFEQVSEGVFVSVLERSRLISRLPGMAWCSPTDTVGALARRIAANGREMLRLAGDCGCRHRACVGDAGLSHLHCRFHRPDWQRRYRGGHRHPASPSSHSRRASRGRPSEVVSPSTAHSCPIPAHSRQPRGRQATRSTSSAAVYAQARRVERGHHPPGGINRHS